MEPITVESGVKITLFLRVRKVILHLRNIHQPSPNTGAGISSPDRGIHGIVVVQTFCSKNKLKLITFLIP